MKVTGILAIICIVISFLMWLSNWVIWTFFYESVSHVPYLATIQSVTAFIANCLELLAVLLVAIGLVVVSGKVKAAGGTKS